MKYNIKPGVICAQSVQILFDAIFVDLFTTSQLYLSKHILTFTSSFTSLCLKKYKYSIIYFNQYEMITFIY